MMFSVAFSCLILLFINPSITGSTTSEVFNRNVLDYYYLLPDSPYFDRELGKDSPEARKAGLQYQNIRSGYLVGGHQWGPSFTMALFKNRTDGIDYIMIRRVRYPGDMFEGFFHFLQYTEDQGWRPANSLLPDLSKHSVSLNDYEDIIPIVPEKGTTVKYVKWDHDQHSSGDTNYEGEGEYLFSYKWDGRRFVLVADTD
jgi:hypothetical protein